MRQDEWWTHRREMSNYMPMMIAFKRKRRGWLRTAEDILAWVLTILYVAAGGFVVYFLYTNFGWNPVIVIIAELVLYVVLFNCAHKFAYWDDSGPHNLPGYDRTTGTVPDLEKRGHRTSELWPQPGHTKYDRRRRR